MPFRRFPLAAALIVLGSCATPERPPAPPPRVVTPAPRPAPPPVVATGSDWRDWPATPGDWSYTADPRGSVARFGRAGASPLLSLRCDRAARTVTFGTAAAGSATVRTTTVARALALQDDGAGTGATVLPANDPLLDAMGFSRGRFAVEQPGAATLVVPAWAEILRVAEDCRG